MSEERKIVKAKIISTQLRINDHGIMDLWIYLEWNGDQQEIGGWCLGVMEKETRERIGWSPAMIAIRKILEVVGVSWWEDLQGKLVRLKIVDCRTPPIIGNITNDEWFDLSEFFKEHQTSEIVSDQNQRSFDTEGSEQDRD